MKHAWYNGEIVKVNEVGIPLYDHGILYGDGVFEGIRFYNKKAFQVDAHLRRLQQSAQAIAISIPYNSTELKQAVDTLIQGNALEHGYLRLVVTRGVGTMGLDPRKCAMPNCFILIDELTMLDDEIKQKGVSLKIASTRRIPNQCIDSRIKSLNYLNLILAKMEATSAGADEAVLLNMQGNIAEGTADNIFIVKSGCLFTPPVADGALDGITRGLIIELAMEQGIKVVETSLAPYDLYLAEECFLCGTGAELIAVASVDGRKLTNCPGEMFLHISTLYNALINKETC